MGFVSVWPCRYIFVPTMLLVSETELRLYVVVPANVSSGLSDVLGDAVSRYVSLYIFNQLYPFGVN